MLKNRILLLAIAIFVVFLGCGSTSPPADAPAEASAEPGASSDGKGHEHHGHHKGEHKGKMGKCPMKVEGTTVTSEETADGAAVVFKTDGGDVEELRRRVRHMADKHAKHHGQPGADKSQMDHGKCAMCRMMKMATVTVEDIDGGARMMMKPKDASKLDALRKHAAEHAEKMAKMGGCPMMSNAGAAQPPTDAAESPPPKGE